MPSSHSTSAASAGTAATSRLAERLGQAWPASAFLPLAARLAEVVGGLHHRGAVHGALAPANIRIVGATGEVRLEGAGGARLTGAQAAPLGERALPYLAPEQTGWLDRDVDARSDLYSLGIIFYQLLTGRLPFQARDTLEWLHCHLARDPAPPAEVDPRISPVLSDLVMKLLAKAAEARYQSAGGLRHDLELALSRLAEDGSVAPFPLATHDVPDRLQVPRKLYGRDRESEALLQVFARVASTGTPEGVILSGGSGVGKSALASELQRAVVAGRGRFLAGKFDAYKRGIPYATLAQALGGLVLEVLGGSDEEVATWRERLRRAVGAHAQRLIDLIPPIELLIGKPPATSPLPQTEDQRGLFMALQALLTAFATAEHPAVLFLDDLQWADSATLAWLGHLTASTDARHVLLVGGFRADDAGSPLAQAPALAWARGAQLAITELTLGPLAVEPLVRLLADTLHQPPEVVRPLAALLHEKTAGNPLFVRQFLGELHQDGSLAFDPEAAAWRWDLERIGGKRITDNVVDLVTVKLRRLSAPAQRVLQLAASAGDGVDVETLSLAAGSDVDEVHDLLIEAVAAGVMVRQRSDYRFLHDRVRQAAHALTPEGEQAGVHLRLGRTLLARLRDDDPPERLFEAVNQLNLGAGLVTEAPARIELAALNLRAARRARGTAAFAAAADHARRGLALLPESAWQSHHELAFALALEELEGAILVADLPAAERLALALLPRAASRAEQAAVHRWLVDLHTKRMESARALEYAGRCLALYGLELPASPTAQQVDAREEALLASIGARSIESLVDLPVLRDPDLEAAESVLATLLPTAYFADPHLHRLAAVYLVQLTVQHGVTAVSPAGIMAFGFELCMAGRYAEADRFGRLGVALVDRHGLAAGRPSAHVIAGASIAPFSHPLETSLGLCESGLVAALEVGDLLFAVFGSLWTAAIPYHFGRPLDEITERAQRSLNVLQRAGYAAMSPHPAAVLNLARNLGDPEAGALTLDGPLLNERHFEEAVEPVTLPVAALAYHLFKLQARCFDGNWEEAQPAAAKTDALLFWMRGTMSEVEAHTFCALALAHAPEPPLDEIRRHAAYLRRLADHCPANFLGRHALVEAELARASGAELEALGHYEEAIRAAREHGPLQIEALAHEGAGLLHLARGRATAARAHLLSARDAYHRWGAAGRTAALDRRHAALFGGAAATDRALRAEQFDTLAASKASQAISSQVELAALIATLLTAARQQAGAERAVMLFQRDGELVAEAQDPPGAEAQDPPGAEAPLPMSVIRRAWRTRERLVLDAGAAGAPPPGDPYLARVAPRSVLCLPIVRQGEVRGLLYLENRQVAGAFTPARLAALELIAAQAAISLDNAWLLGREREARAAAEQLYREAQEAVRLRDEFLTVASHELNTPVATFMLNLEGLAGGPGGPPLEAEAVANMARRAVGQGRRLQRLVEELLDVSRLERGQLALVPEEVDLGRLVDETVERFRPELERARCPVTLALASGVVGLWDPARLEQVVLNLLSNAAKFGARAPIAVTVSRDDDQARLSIRDQGIGIAAADVRRLFERFTRAVSPVNFGGLGLGLYICRRIIQAHGGAIAVESEPGKGATFIVTLPVTRSDLGR